MLPIVHSDEVEFQKVALVTYLPTSIQRVLLGEVKVLEWRSNPLKNKVESQDISIKQNMLVLRSLKNPLKPETLELKFAANIHLIGNVFVRCVVIYNEECLVTHREFSVMMNIVPINGRNMLYKLFLTSLEIEKILLKRFMDMPDLSKKSLLDSLIKLIQMVRVVQNTFTSMISFPLVFLRKLYKYSTMALLMNTFDKSNSRHTVENFLELKPFHHTLNCRSLIKLHGKYCIVIVSTMKGFNQADSLYRLVLYWPQSKRTFTFHMYENDWTTAEIGLHKQVMDKSSKFSRIFGIVQKSVFIPPKQRLQASIRNISEQSRLDSERIAGSFRSRNVPQLMTPQPQSTTRLGMTTRALSRFGPGNVSFGAYAEKKSNLAVTKPNLFPETPFTPFTPYTPHTPYETEAMNSTSRLIVPGKEVLQPGSSVDVSRTSGHNQMVTFGSGAEKNPTKQVKSIRSINELVDHLTVISGPRSNHDSKKESTNMLPNYLTHQRQTEAVLKPSSKAIGRVLEGLDYVTPKNVLEEYEKYELKSVELIQEEVLNHRKINLKHTRDCVLAFAGPHTLSSDVRREKYKKFSTSFYWKCMLQMMSIVAKPKCARVLISKYDGKLLETVYESENIIKEELIRVRFTICHESGYQHKKLVITTRTEVDVELTNFTSHYTRSDRLTFLDLAHSFESSRLSLEPKLGNLRILCRAANRTLVRSLSALSLSKANLIAFLQHNLRSLLVQPTVSIRYYSDVESKAHTTSNNDSLSRSKSQDDQETTDTIDSQNPIKFSVLQSLQRISSTGDTKLQPRLVEDLNLDQTQCAFILLLKKLFIQGENSIVCWLYWNRVNSSVLVMFFTHEQSLVGKRTFWMDQLRRNLPFLEILLETCSFYQAGVRIFSLLKEQMLVEMHHGTLFDYINNPNSSSQHD